MLKTIDTLAHAGRARMAVLPKKAVEAPHSLLLEGARQRNAVLDAAFYDLGTVTPDEARHLAPWLAQEGGILIVPPSGQGEVVVCPTIAAFAEQGGADVRSLAVAGVGSSALGSAAFARNIADATGAAVAAVVSGYGVADVITEGLGGWFWFGTVNRLRHTFEYIDRLSEDVPHAAAASSDGLALNGLGISRDTAILLELLADKRFAFSLLTGHSKGNLILAETLYALVGRARHLGEPLQLDPLIVTFSAAIALPDHFRRIIDVMGSIDNFGVLNSTPGIRIDRWVPGAWHHTNTRWPRHLPVTHTLAEILAQHA
jgi:hypothetical protein